MDTKERKTPVQDTCPAPGSVCRTQSWRPAKIELEKPELFSRVSAKIFGSIFPRLILGCSSPSEAFQPAFGLADQAQQPASFFGRQARIVEQFSAMQNDPPLAL